MSKVAKSISSEANWNIFVISYLEVKSKNEASIPGNKPATKDDMLSLLIYWQSNNDETVNDFLEKINEDLKDESWHKSLLENIKKIIGEILI